MASKFHVGLLIICLSRSIGIARANWDYPPFFEPDPKDKALLSFDFVETTKRTNIVLEEEVDHEVCIAVLNYKDDPKPSVGPLSDDKSNSVLGAVLRRNDITKIWSLCIMNPQDYETEMMQEYRFSIYLGSVTNTIALNIQNIDDNAPVIQALEKNCTIRENYVGPSNCTYVVSDADGWIDQIEINLSFAPVSNNFRFITSPGEKPEYELKAFLNVTNSLDFEAITMYMLLIQATDGAKNNGTLDTVVKVIDMPDEPPVWTRITAAENIMEKSTKSFNVTAIDGDIQINAEINYMIQVNDQKDSQDFSIDEKTGLITINEIDRDERKQEIFRFLVIAYEKSDPKSRINTTIVVIVEDKNDHWPEITPDYLKIKIDEGKSTTLEFNSSIEIKDPDLAENAQFSVSLIDESKYNWSSAFLVVPTSGYQNGIFTISIANASLLDYEDANWRFIDIQLQAIERKNTSHIGTRNIRIELNNLNDELPIFDDKIVSNVTIREDVEEGFTIATVHATDLDIDDNVTHSLVAQRTLTIDEKTGVIVTNQADALDYESMPVVVVQVVATDLANHKTYATLTINVKDVNDVPPKLYLPNKSPRLVEELPSGTRVDALINATDIDTDGELWFSIDWANTRAQKSSVDIDESFYRGHLGIQTDWPVNERNKTYAEGKLIVTGRIDYEAFDVMFLTISVTDNKTVHNDKTTFASLTLYIEDTNDNSPIFDEPIESMNVTENQVKDALIGSVLATDIDGRNFSKVSYFIEPINNTKNDLVVINNLTGVIRVGLDKGIDAEKYEFMYYNVTATDGGRNSTPKTIAIYVIDQNDEVPYLIDKEFFNSTIRKPEKSPNGTHIVTIRAADDDRTSPFNTVSYLFNEQYSAPMRYFSIGKFDGSINVNLSDGHVLDRDFGQSEFTLNLKIRDNYLFDYVTSYSNAIDMTVTVILTDINDQDPILPNCGEPAKIVTENTKEGDLILWIEANDRDDPMTNNTKVFYVIKNISPADENHVFLREDYENLFTVNTRNDSIADIFANRDLKGYYGRWIIELYAQDRGTDPGPRNNTRNYVVQVKDFNYNKPNIKFPTSQTLPLRKEQTIHAQLITYDDQLLKNFQATDEDHGDSGIVTFSLTSTTGEHENFEIVSISTNVAQLRLAKAIDVEAKNSYTLKLIATDGGNPPFDDTREFTIIFVTKSGPKFDKNEWDVWIKENTAGPNTSVIIPIEAHDMIGETNGNTLKIYYFFMPDEIDAEYFALDRVTRELTVTKELDREKQEVMKFRVIATTDENEPPRNPLNDAILNISVIVLDDNDNSPIFERNIYFAGVAIADALDKVVLTVKATDVDLNDTLTYGIVSNSLTTSHSSLEPITDPFSIDPDNGNLLLKFTITNNMEGYFKFDIMVHDKVKHEGKSAVRVYVVPETSRVIFTFNNLASYVKEQRLFVIDSFTNVFGYTCNIDDIKSTMGTNGQVIDNSTTLTTHFISSKDNLPIESETIILASSDLQTISNLKAILLTKLLYLVAVPIGNSTSTDDTRDIVHWIFVSLTILFFLCSITLLVVFVVTTRRLNRRLDKLAITKYDSQESGLERAGVVPTTNQFAQAGSNPMWKIPEKSIDDDVSQGSGDSDLIGIEENPDFGYVNGAMMADEKWINSRWENVNPIFAKPEVTSGGLFDRISHSEEEKNRNNY